MQTNMERPRLFRVNEAANYAAVSRSTLYAERQKGRIKFIKIGSGTRIEVTELDRWINEASAA